ncbi:MAG: preprotein translocase subunit SecE [Brachymonas sp.]|nr:preprotein translocase subunit SecE [Brachymonas sp.]
MAAEQIETVNTGADKAKLAVSVLLVLAGIVGFYMLAKQGQIAQWGALIAAIVAAVVVFLSSEPGKEFVAFGRDAVREAKKVVWPTRKESMQMTGYVFAFVVVMALFLWLTDKSLEWIIFSLILGWR